MTERLLDTHEDSEGILLTPSFARHETFHPRYGWLKKGFDAARKAPDIFIAPDATTRLGVGKNMVRAIRYWCTAYKILEERPNPDNSRLRDAHPTILGERLLGNDGWDPYLEDPGSLWLLHWQLLRSPCTAPAWFAIFNRFPGSDFTDETLANQLELFCEGHPEWGEVAATSLLKDARCLLRMYASVTAGRDLLEDTIDSPFVDLELIRVLRGSRRHYTLNVGPKRSLPAAVAAYACVDFAAQQQTSARLMTLTRLTHAPGSPGRAFQLSEVALAELLDDFSERHGSLRLTQAAGTRQVVLDDRTYEHPLRLLDLYYRASRSTKVAA
jgi:hypothetical protein